MRSDVSTESPRNYYLRKVSVILRLHQRFFFNHADMQLIVGYFSAIKILLSIFATFPVYLLLLLTIVFYNTTGKSDL